MGRTSSEAHRRWDTPPRELVPFLVNEIILFPSGISTECSSSTLGYHSTDRTEPFFSLSCAISRLERKAWTVRTGIASWKRMKIWRFGTKINNRTDKTCPQEEHRAGLAEGYVCLKDKATPLSRSPDVAPEAKAHGTTGTTLVCPQGSGGPFYKEYLSIL